MKRLAGMILVCALMMSCSLGCNNINGDETSGASGGYTGATTGPAEKIELNLAWQYIKESQQQVWHQYIFEPFMQKHPEVRINFQTFPDWQTTVRIKVAAGAGPDMFYMDSFDIPYYAAKGQILNLEKYRRQYQLDDVMYDWAIRSTLFKEQMYALPQSVEATAMTYNKTLLDRLGKDVPRTRAEYVDVCHAALKAGLIPVAFGYSGVNILLQWFYEHYMTAYCGADPVRQLLTGERRFDDGLFGEAFTLMKLDWDAGYINERKSGATTMNEARALFTNQQAVFNFEGAWLTLVDTAPGTWQFEWGQTIWPSMRDGVPAASAISLGEAIGITTTSEYPDLCVEMMMDYYLDEKVAAQVVANGFSTPARPIDPALYPKDMPADIQKALAAQSYNMSQPGTCYAPWGFYPPRFNEFIIDHFEQVLYNQMDLDTFITGGQASIEQDFADGFVFAG